MAKVKYYAKENTKLGTHSWYAVPVPKAGENDFSKNNLSAILDIDTFRRIHHSTTAEVIDGVILFLLAGYSLLDSC